MIEIKKVFFNIEAKNFSEMIKKVSKDLISMEYITNSFESSIISRENKYPTGLSFNGIDIAIPHTDPINVKKSGIIAVNLKNPIKMIHMATNDKELLVKNFFILLVNEGKFQMNLLTELMEKFNDKEVQGKLMSIKSAKELEKIFR